MPSNLTASFVRHVLSRPHETALISLSDRSTRCVTWLQLATLVTGVAREIEREIADLTGFQRRIVYTSENTLADIVLALASPICGAVEVPIDDHLGTRASSEIRNRVGGIHLEKSLVEDFIGRIFANEFDTDNVADPVLTLRRAASQIDEDEPALILWTSGTSGSAKGVVLSHRNLYGNAYAKWKTVPQTAADVRLTALPIAHAYARTCDLGTWLISGSRLATGSGFAAWEQLGPLVRPTVANTVPSLAQRLLRADKTDLGLDRLRWLGCGGAAMNESDFHAWKSCGVTVIQGYGLTESSPVICSATPDNALPGLVGGLVEGWESDLRDERLFVRGAHTMIGYFEDELETSQRIDQDGWLDTGDLVRFDDDSGQFRIIGRADDAIVLPSGHVVHPREIEREIEQIAGIRHALVMGRDRDLQIWLDADPAFNRDQASTLIASKVQHRPQWERPSQVLYFENPLRIESGELNAKGAIRRGTVIKKRIGNKSPSVSVD